MNKKILAGVVVTVLIGISVGLYWGYIKPNYESAIVEYETAVNDYSTVVASFAQKKDEFNKENDLLENTIRALQEVLDSGDKPYDESLVPNSNEAINKGKVALVSLQEPEYYNVIDKEYFNVFQFRKINSEVENIRATTDVINNTVQTMEIPDYSVQIDQIKKAQKELEDSIRQLKQVTCPEETFVLKRIYDIKEDAGMVDIIALTEDNDPENRIGKNGWYTSKIIFQHKDVENYFIKIGMDTLAETGNPAGGCVEVYSSVDDAVRRDNDLKSMEGTVRHPGAHEVCGTLVIRVTEDIKTSTQKELMRMLKEAMLRLE